MSGFTAWHGLVNSGFLPTPLCHFKSIIGMTIHYRAVQGRSALFTPMAFLPFVLMSLCGASEDEELNDSNEEALRERLNQFAVRNARIRKGGGSTASVEILSVTPRKSPAAGGAAVFLSVRGVPSPGTAFCRFDTAIVRGEVLADSSLVCVAPRHSPGEAPLAVSLDRGAWSADWPFVYTGGVAAAHAALAALLALAVTALALFLFRVQRRKSGRGKHGRTPASLLAGWRSAAAVRRKNVPLL
jgi:hypothetical protein